MNTGLEKSTDAAIIQLTANLKSGIIAVVGLGEAAYIAKSHKECPPIAAFEVNMSLLECFRAECNKRGIDYDAIEPDISEYEEYWLNITS